MATQFSILGWRIPWTEEPGGLQSIRLQSQTPPKQMSTLSERDSPSLVPVLPGYTS